MTDRCSAEGCEKVAKVKGLCSAHYQQQRRQQPERFTHPGRPRAYAKELADPGGGAPKISIRFEPELLQWVQHMGGGPWLRDLARKLRELSKDPEFADWWGQLANPGSAQNQV